MTTFNHFFTDAEVKQISENLNTNRRLKVHLSERSVKLMRTTHFSRQDIDHAINLALNKQKSGK